jgi:hypothetical protein
MDLPHHIIRRQVVQVECQSAEMADQVQGRLSQFQQQTLLPLLQSIFDEMGEGLRIETLEIDLGEIPLHGLEQAIVQKLPEILRTQLKAHALQVHQTRGSHPAAAHSIQGTDMELLLHFLKSGELPWWVPTADRNTCWERMVRLLQASPAAVAAQLQRTAAKHPQMLQRLSAQMPVAHFLPILQSWVPAQARAYEDALATLQSTLTHLGFPGGVQRKLWALILQDASAGALRIADPVEFFLWALRQIHIATPVAQFLDRIQRIVWAIHMDRLQLPRNSSIEVDLKAHTSLAADPNPATIPWGQVRLHPPLLQSLARVTGLPPETIQEILEATHPEPAADSTPPTLSLPSLSSASQNLSNKARKEGLLIHNAGLVLLWPYYQRLLQGLQLVEDKVFKSEEARTRAIHILQYIATGSEVDTPEYDLTLNKLLTGHPLDEPVTAGFEITPDEKAEADAMIEAAIRHWPILRQMSIPAFRGAFLMRLGRLTDIGHAWDLDVEAAAFDMLVEYIPWTFSIVLLPWMERRLHVAWNT